MLCAIENVPTSTLRQLVTTHCNVHASTYSTRKEYIQLLHAHGIFSIQEEEEDQLLVYDHEPTTTSRELLFVHETRENVGMPPSSCVAATYALSLNNHHYQHIIHPGSKILTDTALRTMCVRDTLYVRDSITFENSDTDLRSLLESTLHTICAIKTELEMVRGNLETLNNNINVYKDTVSISTTNEIGEAFPFQIVDNAANVEYDNAYALYLRESSTITIHMGMRVTRLTTSSFAVQLPLAITRKVGVSANIRLILKTNIGNSTMGRVYPSRNEHHNRSWLYVESNLFLESDVCPIHIQLDGTYVTDNMDNIVWVTPMRFDTLRHMSISPVLVSAPTLSYVSGQMQWNRIEERTEVITNTLFDVRDIFSDHHVHTIQIELPRLISNNEIANYKFSGYGTVFLHGSNQFMRAPPEVHVDGTSALLNQYRMNVRLRTGTYTGRLALTTHVIYYQSEDDERTHRFAKPVVHANVHSNDRGVLSVTQLTVHDGYDHQLNTPILQRPYDVTIRARRLEYTTKNIEAIIYI